MNKADRIIYEQQLGLTWKPPKEDLFRNIDPAYFQQMDDRAQDIAEAEQAFEQGMNERIANQRIEGEVLDKRESLAAKFQDQKGNSKSIKRILELLCNEAGFLVEDKLQKLLSPLHKDEQSLMRLDSIFKALGVETMEDIERLTNNFFIKSKTENNNLNGEDEYADHSGGSGLIHPNNVVMAIREFVDEARLGGVVVRKTRVQTAPKLLEDEVHSQTEAPIQNVSQIAKVKNLQKEYWVINYLCSG
jgi:dynein regulatory complex protein 1